MKTYLLDTTVFLWNSGAPEKLNREVRDLLAGSEDPVFVSAATSWEIAIKSASGKLRLPEPVREFMSKRVGAGGFTPLPITNEHAIVAGELPRHHSDPFDRMLIAQAVTDGMVLISADPQLLKYSAETLWAAE